MPLSKLPPLPAIGVGPTRPFQRVLLADILVRLRECDPLPLSRRDLAEAYNRTSGSRVSKHLRVLVGTGWLSLAKRSQGKKAHCYSRGWRLRQNPGLASEWEALGDGLWGSEGLLSAFKDSAAFGYGMLGESRLICLGALIRAREPVTKAQLQQVLSHHKQQTRSLTLIVRTDKTTEHGHLLDLLEVAKGMGIEKVVLATEDKEVEL